MDVPHPKICVPFVQRVWREADLRPQRLARYMASNDRDFETKAAEIIGLYLDPPRHAAVFCIDEKTAIQALDRRDRLLPLSPGRVERHGFEYKRHGTLSLYAALNVRTGEVQGKTTARHTSRDFVGFLGEVVATRESDEAIHVILDNLSAHNEARGGIPRRASERDVALHADLFLVAESGGAVVLEGPAGRTVARHLHVDGGPGAEAAAVHQRLLEAGEALPLEVCQPREAHHSWGTFFKDSPLVSASSDVPD